MLALADVEGVFDEAAMPQRDALGRRSSARRVEDVSDVLGRHRLLQLSQTALGYVAGKPTHLAPGVCPCAVLYAVYDNHAQMWESLRGQRAGPAALQLRDQLAQHHDVIMAQEASGGDEHSGLRTLQYIGQLPRPIPGVEADECGP